MWASGGLGRGTRMAAKGFGLVLLAGTLAAGCGKNSHPKPGGGAAKDAGHGGYAGLTGNGGRAGRGTTTHAGTGGRAELGGAAATGDAGAGADNGGSEPGVGGAHHGGTGTGGTHAVGGNETGGTGTGHSGTGGVGGTGVTGSVGGTGGAAGEGGEAGTSDGGAAPGGGRGGTAGNGAGTSTGGFAGTSSGGAGTLSGFAGTSSGGAGTSSGYAGTSSGYAGTSSGYAGTSSGSGGVSAGGSGALGGAAGTSGGSAGTWGGRPPGYGIDPCATPSGETCDGVDNDCNGTIDDLGEFTCGLGACQRTVAACTDGVLGVCVPATPTTTLDDCNGIDDDCDGAVDEDCAACIHVALDGDDVLAASNAATTPFQSLQAALDFAAGHREIAPRVCVAAGPTCGASATYAGPPGGDLTMHDGIDLLANYESTNWTRCSDSTTHIAPTARGVVFPSDIVVGSNLDGFTIDRPKDPALVAGVTVDGAQGVLLSNLTIVVPAGVFAYSEGRSYGVNILAGASATVARSRIDAGLMDVGDSAAVHANASRVFIEDNCSGPTDPTTGRCTGACGGSGAQLSEAFVFAGHAYAVLLEDSPGSRVERSTVCGLSNSGVDSVAIEASGPASDLQIRANTVSGSGSGASGYRTAGIQLEECGDGAPWIVDNASISGAGASVNVIRAVGACHPVIEANQSIVGLNLSNAPFFNTAISCEAGSVPSRCVLANNASIVGTNESAAMYGQNFATGVKCQGGSCARISNSRILSLQNGPFCQGGACQRTALGLVIDGGSPIVNDNVILPGQSGLRGAARFMRWGVEATGTATFLRNQISDGFTGTAAKLESNAFSGSSCEYGYDPLNGFIYGCSGIAWSGGGKLVNNCIDAAYCNCGDGLTDPGPRAAFYETGTGADPLVFQNNQLNFASGPLYLDEGTTPLTTADQVNALTDMTVSGTLAGTCTTTPYQP